MNEIIKQQIIEEINKKETIRKEKKDTKELKNFS
jgi:hypothetical protein